MSADLKICVLLPSQMHSNPLRRNYFKYFIDLRVITY